ncbi:hypothetical protein WJX77_012607 [Trebouxia sp. C0004]
MELDSFLQQYIVDLQGSGATSAQATPADLHSSWLPINSQVPYQLDTAQPLCTEYTEAFTHFPEVEQLVPPCAADVSSQEQQDNLHHSSSGSGIALSDGRPTASSNKRTEAWTAKNRRAQKKFREKQKANKNDMQQQLAEMTAQLNALQTEHNKLTGRNVVLEKVLHSRQRQLEILQDQRKATQEQSVSVQEQQPNQLALPKQLPPLRPLDLAQVPSQPAQIQAREVDAVYAELVEKMRGIVHKLQEQGHSLELNAQLEQQCSVMAHFINGTVLSNADNLRKLYMVNMNPEAWDENELLYRSPQHWQAVTDCLKLTPEQREEMIKLRATSLAKQAENQAQWHQLCTAIAQATEYDPANPEMQPALALDDQRLAALKANLRRGQAIWLELYEQIFGRVWTSMQYAQAVITSGPHHVDALAIASCVAHQQQQQQNVSGASAKS